MITGYLYLNGNKYLRRYPERLRGAKDRTTGVHTITLFHSIYFKVQDKHGESRLLDTEEYRQFILFGQLPEQLDKKVFIEWE